MKKIKNLQSKTAYSLIELSIVILIISILITGALSVSVSSINNAKIKTTNDRIKELYNALGNYLLVNNKLPCPADITQLKTSASYGTAATNDGACTGTATIIISGNFAYGMFPVKSLNLPLDMAEDGFESKIGYIVDVRLTGVAPANTPAPTTGFNTGFTNGAFTTPNPPALNYPTPILTVTSNPAGTATTADFALISYGANKFGSYGINSSTAAGGSTDTDEQANYGTPDASLVSNSTNSDIFDDIVFGKKRIEMVADFKAFNALPCLGYTETGLYGFNFIWPQSSYDQAVSSTTACSVAGLTHSAPNPVRRCGAFGQWGAILAPCT
jgi:prepilin-type N-terminal cleavage/methylation domain-containing protein